MKLYSNHSTIKFFVIYFYNIKDESGEIEFAEFVKLASRFVEPEEDYDQLRKELREVFMLYDKEARGFLPLDEFKIILREIDPELPEDELDEMIDEIDGRDNFLIQIH